MFINKLFKFSEVLTWYEKLAYLAIEFPRLVLFLCVLFIIHFCYPFIVTGATIFLQNFKFHIFPEILLNIFLRKIFWNCVPLFHYIMLSNTVMSNLHNELPPNKNNCIVNSTHVTQKSRKLIAWSNFYTYFATCQGTRQSHKTLWADYKSGGCSASIMQGRIRVDWATRGVHPGEGCNPLGKTQ